jgi:hypothetical protein
MMPMSGIFYSFLRKTNMPTMASAVRMRVRRLKLWKMRLRVSKGL